MASNEIRVKNWAELQDVLFQDSWDDRLKRYRSSYVYRGVSDSSYQLDTSLKRLGGDFSNLEGHLLRNFKKYARQDLLKRDSIWSWLAMAQHYGLPTRLLDWTYSPYVALHFATSNIEKFSSDGVIWGVNFVKTNRNLPLKLQYVLQAEGSNSFTVDMMDLTCVSLREFDALQKESFAVFLEPPAIDERIVNQYALFSLLSNPETSLSEWLKPHPDVYFKIIIPAELKWEIRDKLDQANITERVLFPGLDGLTRWLKRHYSPTTDYRKENP